MKDEKIGLAMRVSVHTLIANLFLSVGKLIVGLAAHSTALVSDAVHSASDAVSTVIVMIGLRVAGKAADQEHPYGHERFECVYSIVLAILLLFTGFAIGKSVLEALVGEVPVRVPGKAALGAAVISVLAKEGMYHYTMWAAKKVASPALKADAWHHRSDALSSVGSAVGILGARMGFPKLDCVAGGMICLLILKVAVDIMNEAFRGVVDTACDDETAERLRAVISAEEGVKGIDLLTTRRFGNKLYVDAEICAEGSLSLYEAHKIAERVHRAVENQFPEVKHCMVHVNPAAQEGT